MSPQTTHLARRPRTNHGTALRNVPRCTRRVEISSRQHGFAGRCLGRRVRRRQGPRSRPSSFLRPRSTVSRAGWLARGIRPLSSPGACFVNWVISSQRSERGRRNLRTSRSRRADRSTLTAQHMSHTTTARTESSIQKPDFYPTIGLIRAGLGLCASQLT